MSEGSEAHVRLPSLGIPEPGKGTPRVSGFEGQWDLILGDPKDWGKWDFTLKGKRNKLIEAWSRQTWLSWDNSWSGAGWLWLTLKTEKLVADIGGSYLLHGHCSWWSPSWDLPSNSSVPRADPIQQAVGLLTHFIKQLTGQGHSPPISRQAA